MPAKPWKMALWATLLLAASFWFGSICRHMGIAHQLLVIPFREFARLLLWLLLCTIVLNVLSGMAVVLFRPQWTAYAAFCISGLALWAGWGFTVRNAGLSLLYVVVGIVYTVLTNYELQQRIRFSVRAVAQNWRLLTVGLILLAVSSFYSGFARHVRDRGSSIVAEQVDGLTSDMAAEVVDGTLLSSLQIVRQELVQQIQSVLKLRVSRLLGRVEPFFPPLAAGILFLALFALTWLIGWVPLLIVYVLVPVLVSLGIAEMATETVDVQRLVFSEKTQ
jgi:hypothetical protein